MIKYQPFRYTTISASVNYYHAYGNRPNAMPPRDNLSYWIASGKPTWDPVTQQIHINGATVATVTAATYNGPDYFTASYLGQDHNQMFIDQNGLSYWAAPRGTTSTAGPSLATLQAARYLQTTAAAGATFSGTAPRPFAQYLFNTTPTISNRSIYDWSSINLSAPNRFWDRTLTSNFNVDQMIINTAAQTLAAQVSFMREDSARWTRNLVGIVNDNGQSGQLMVDINERRLDGSVNPFLLRPYLSVDKPRTVSQPQKWDTSRAQIAYRLDMTGEKGALRHLGWFQFTGYGEYKYRVNRQYSWRDAMSSDVPWIAAGTYRGYQGGPPGTPCSTPCCTPRPPACSARCCAGSRCPGLGWPRCCLRCIRCVSNPSPGSPSKKTPSQRCFAWPQRWPTGASTDRVSARTTCWPQAYSFWPC
jgi:hypothetical protein